MKTQHTQGQWKVEYLGSVPKVATDDSLIADIVYKGIDQDEADANAKLIAAAPELLRMLKKTIDIIKDSELISPDTYNKAIELIKAATE